jgi:hypothetical protein
VNRGPEFWLPPLVALSVLAAAATQTVGALHVTGAFGWQADAVPVAVPPVYEAVNQALDRHDPRLSLEAVHDPFVARTPAVALAPKPAPRAEPPPPPPELPILTAIVWDNDPRALVHWKDRDWTVREGGLFDEFEVVSITRDQVSLRRGDATMVLQRRNPGE